MTTTQQSNNLTTKETAHIPKHMKIDQHVVP
jgi:hypothetical protein